MAATATSLIGILPLLAAGYIFNSIFYYSRFRLSKADGQRLFFACAISGLLIGCIAFPISKLAKIHLTLVSSRSDAETLDLIHWVQHAIPFPYVVTYLVAMAIAVLLGHLFNIYLYLRKRYKAPKDGRRVSVWAYWRCMSESITALDKLIRRAVEEDSLVMLCLKSRKVYCGVVVEVRSTQETTAAHINIIPAFSVTRDKDTLKFDWDTKTEYKAYSLKQTLDRKKSLEAEICEAERLTEAVIQVLRRNARVHPGVSEEVYWEPVKDLKRERAALESRLAVLDGGDIDLSEWAKVIPVTELESISLYKNEDQSKWFDIEVSLPGSIPEPHPETAA